MGGDRDESGEDESIHNLKEVWDRTFDWGISQKPHGDRQGGECQPLDLLVLQAPRAPEAYHQARRRSKQEERVQREIYCFEKVGDRS
jgi:hypothetical protein